MPLAAQVAAYQGRDMPVEQVFKKSSCVNGGDIGTIYTCSLNCPLREGLGLVYDRNKQKNKQTPAVL